MISLPVKETIKIKNIHSFFRLPCSSTFEFSGETHNFWEMMYVTKGSLCVSADEKVYELSEGQIIFHKPMELHKFYITDKNGAEILVFSCDMEGQLTSFFEEKVFTLNAMQKNIPDELIYYAEKHSSEGNMYSRYLPAFENVETYSHTVSMYIELLMHSLYESGNVLSQTCSDDSVPFTKAVQYMNEHADENLSVTDIAKHLNSSVSNLKRTFSKYAGMGPHKYFLKLKLKKATYLLDGGCSVTEVAEKLGFSSQGYFTIVFKRELGLLPSENKMRGR